MREAAQRALDVKIAGLEQRLERLRGLRSALEDDEILADLVEVFATNCQKGPLGRGGKNIQIVRQFFRDRDNRAATLMQIVETTGISKHSLRQLVYKVHVDEFEREGHRGGGRESLFWLKEHEEEAQ